MIDLVMEAQQKENTRLPVLKDQLRDTEKRLANLLEAIEQGILTPTTKQRLDELEARKEALNTSILEEELKKPVLTREWMRFWFEKFRKGDMRDMEHQRQIIDTFVNSVLFLTTGSCSISTSRTIPKPSPVKRCWVRVLWTMLRQIEWADEFYSSVHSFFAGTSPVHPVFGAYGIMLTHCHSPATPESASWERRLPEEGWRRRRTG